MKRLISVFAVIAALLSFTSCEKEATKAIVGTWEATTAELSMGSMKMEVDIAEAGYQIKITFNKDGVATLTQTVEGESVSATVSYSVDGNTLIIEEEGEVAQIPITIEKKHMTWTVDGEMLDEPGAMVTIHFEKI